MKLVADENIPLCEAFFGDFGDIVRLPGRQMTAAHLADADALLVRSVTRVNAGLLENTPVRFVGTCTIGTDHLDTAWLESAGITWANAPGCNANSVVEYVYAALSALDINWRERRFGIIGCGNVGGLLHRRLRAQGVDCRCYDPFLSPADNPDLAPLEEVLAADVVCLHTPLTTDGPHPTHHLLDAAHLRLLRPGAVLLNAGRGEVIDNAALLARLREGVDLTAVLDVWEPEPEISLALLDRVALGTPHIAGYSLDGKLKGTAMIYQALCRHLGVTPGLELAQVAPAVDDPLRRLGGERWSDLGKLIASVYDIRADDRRLRALAAAVRRGEADFAQGFDKLRKDYPVRREFHNYTVASVRQGPSSRWLNALNFNISGSDAGRA